MNTINCEHNTAILSNCSIICHTAAGLEPLVFFYNALTRIWACSHASTPFVFRTLLGSSHIKFACIVNMLSVLWWVCGEWCRQASEDGCWCEHPVANLERAKLSCGVYLIPGLFLFDSLSLLVFLQNYQNYEIRYAKNEQKKPSLARPNLKKCSENYKKQVLNRWLFAEILFNDIH